MDMKAFFKLTYGVYIVTSNDNGKESGCVINTMTQVTNSPLQISITLNKNNYTTSLILNSKIFNVSVLKEDVSMDIIRQFGFQSGKDVNKFSSGNYLRDINDIRYLVDDSVAYFSCNVKQVIDVGTHYMFIAEVVDSKVLNDEPVLTYSDYHLKKNGTTPKNASSYIEIKKQGYRCDVCGFIYEGDYVPKDYICPVCKVDASHFHNIKG